MQLVTIRSFREQHPLRWWQQAVFYQIYPRSFADSNGDGIGDLPGITARMAHLRDLGIDAIWLSPHYPSPQIDGGYDISDYTAVAPEYGTLADFRTLLDTAHNHGIRVVLDLVLNHTSDQHAWFQESRSSRDNPKRDWYIWVDPAPDGGPPNNWCSVFGGVGWTFEPSTGQYYYHHFLKEQPDLNWHNPAVKQAMWDAVRFWLDLGVDGFRLDAVGAVYEHPERRDHDSPLSYTDIYLMRRQARTAEEFRAVQQAWDRLFGPQMQQPGMHELMQELRALIDSYPGDRVLIGEDDNLAFHGPANNELHLVYNFPLMRTRQITPLHVAQNQRERLAALPKGAWPCNTLGNHDVSRMWSAFGDGAHDDELARLNTAMLLTIPGTPFLFNGEEIGMRDYLLTSFDQVRDPGALQSYRMARELAGIPAEVAEREALIMTRDRLRTPLQWDESPHAGFCAAEATPWLPINPNYLHGISVSAQAADPHSILSFYRTMLAIRRAHPALQGGDFALLEPVSRQVLGYMRSLPEQHVVVLLNYSDQEQPIVLPSDLTPITCLFRSQSPAAATNQQILYPFEVFIAIVAAKE